MAETKPARREEQQKPLKGYVVVSTDETFLTDDLFWYSHDKPEEAFVFSRDGVDYVAESSLEKNWDIKPASVIPATWNGSKVKITGEKMNIADLPKKPLPKP